MSDDTLLKMEPSRGWWRDVFALGALIGELASQSPEFSEYETKPEHAHMLARRCFLFADAMLAERTISPIRDKGNA